MFEIINKWLLKLFLSRLKLPRDVHRYAFSKFPDRVMLQYGDMKKTYGELADKSYRAAQAMQSIGLKKGDVVFMQVRPEEELFEIRTAALELGVVFTAFLDIHTAEFIIHAVKEISPKLFIVNADYGEGTVEAIQEHYPDVVVWQTGSGNEYEHFLAQSKAEPVKSSVSPSDPMLMGFTSGTTGTPKCVISNHSASIISLKMMVSNLETPPDRSAININLTAIPLVGAGSGLVMPTMLSGGTLIALEHYSPEHLLEMIKKAKATRLFLTPSQLMDLLDMPSAIDKQIATVTHIVYGTAPMPAAKLEEAITRFGPIFQQGYGQAEILPPVSMLSSPAHMVDGKIASRFILSSCGKVVDGVDVRIAKPDGTRLPTGEIGEVHVLTPTRFDRYLNPEDTAEAVFPDGFFRTGDHGFLDEGNYLHILDRNSDLIATKEGLIYPRLVEEEVHDYPAVKECCLVAVAEKAVLCVSVRQAMLNKDQAEIKKEIMELLESRIQPWQLPVDIVFVDQVPRSLLGKVLRREVRDELNSKQVMQ